MNLQPLPPSHSWTRIRLLGLAHRLFCLALFGCLVINLAHPAATAPTPTAEPHFLSTNRPSFFFSDHLTGASYYRFDPGGFYEEIAREHMGVIPISSGTWKQDSAGMVTIVSTNKNGRERTPEKVRPMVYKETVFLVWPDKSWANDIGPVLQKIDSPNANLHVYNAFQVSEQVFTNGTGKPYPFKYYTNLNQPEVQAPAKSEKK